jgi:hypothetical protein
MNNRVDIEAFIAARSHVAEYMKHEPNIYRHRFRG